MDLKNIQELIKLVKKTDIGELSVTDGNFSVTIKNKAPEPQAIIASPVQMAQPQVVQSNAQQEVKTEEQKPTPKPANDNQVTFRSPMVGTFYRKPGADKEAFVKIGDSIKSGDVLCIIEAMKLFNEIEFDGAAGKIIKVLVEDASPVEYDQPLFLIEKAG
jgi:acetyl-CoA carboxylase biotin carboxyl carrier protein